jgi:hypothetical protein
MLLFITKLVHHLPPGLPFLPSPTVRHNIDIRLHTAEAQTKTREITHEDTQNLIRSEQLPEPRTPIVIEVDHSRNRMSVNSSQTDS